MKMRFAIAVFVGLLIGGSNALGQGVGVKLYIDPDAAGEAKDIPVGTFKLDGKQVAAQVGGAVNYSVKVPAGLHIRFCGEGTTPKCEEFGEGVHNLASPEFVSIRVWSGDAAGAWPAPVTSAPAVPAAPAGPPPVLVYEQTNWLGRSQVFGVGMYRSIKGEFGRISDNHAMSIVVTKGFHAKLCVDEGYEMRGAGNCEEYDAGKYNLRLADSISFIEVTDLSEKSVKDESLPVVLYEDAGQGGKRQGFDVGAFDASRGEFKKLANDTASSINVKKGFAARVCADSPASGGEPAGCEDFGPGKTNLKKSDVASFMIVSKVN